MSIELIAEYALDCVFVYTSIGESPMRSSQMTASRHLRFLRCHMSTIIPAKRVHGQRKDVWSLVNEAAATAEQDLGTPVVNLGQGFFSYSPPQFAIDAAKKALDTPMLNQYSPTRGRPELLQALADAYSPGFGRKLDPKTEVVVTTGANEGMLSAFNGFIDPGDEVIIIEPFFDQYVYNIDLIGGKCVYVPLHPPQTDKTHDSSEWKIDINELKAAITPKTKMIVLNSPHNPVGKVMSKEELLEIGQLCIDNNIIILSDEVYDRLYYREFVRIGSLSDKLWNLTLTVGSAGKTFAATGWRVGWLIGPSHLITPAATAHTRTCFSTVTPLQNATAVALNEANTNDYYESTIQQFKHKYSILTNIFDKLGLPYTVAGGGYFLLVDFSRVKRPAEFVVPEELKQRPDDFAMFYFLTRELGVVSIPCTEFSTEASSPLFAKYLRFAVCKDDSILEDAAKRLEGLAKFIE